MNQKKAPHAGTGRTHTIGYKENERRTKMDFPYLKKNNPVDKYDDFPEESVSSSAMVDKQNATRVTFNFMGKTLVSCQTTFPNQVIQKIDNNNCVSKETTSPSSSSSRTTIKKPTRVTLKLRGNTFLSYLSTIEKPQSFITNTQVSQTNIVQEEEVTSSLSSSAASTTTSSNLLKVEKRKRTRVIFKFMGNTFLIFENPEDNLDKQENVRVKKRMRLIKK